MWWQVLPPLGIIAGCLGVMFAGQGFVHYVFQGTPSHKGVTENWHISELQKQAFRRDSFMVGNDYGSRGLDFIVDEE